MGDPAKFLYGGIALCDAGVITILFGGNDTWVGSLIDVLASVLNDLLGFKRDVRTKESTGREAAWWWGGGFILLGLTAIIVFCVARPGR